MATRTAARTPLELSDITVVEGKSLRKAITAAAVGNGVEWFDFGVYGFVAYALGKVFFPHASPALQTIAALGTFSVPFLMRPLGGLFFGYIGDRLGRQRVLAFTIILMSLSTFCIGLIPGYATIGLWAPALLLLCKLVQGFSVGGEYIGASIFVAEYAPDRRRGFYGSWLDFGSIAGFLLGAGFVVLLQTAMGEAAFLEWGWRLPFLIAAPLGLIGFYLRHSVDETPSFLQEQERQAAEGTKAHSTSFRAILSECRSSLLVCIGMVIVTNISYYMLLTYMPTYLSGSLGYSEGHGVLIIILVMIGMLAVQPLIGWGSDRIGRKPFLFAGSIGLLLLSIPAYYMVGSGDTHRIFTGLLLLALMLSCLIGTMASTLPALFPTRIRYSALACSFNLAVIVAGLTPTIVAWMVETTQNLMMPAYYLMLTGVVGLITAFNIPETACRPLRGDAPKASSDDEAMQLLHENFRSIEHRILAIDLEIERLTERRQDLVLRHPDLD
ncbi:glycine betaine/L-proline transporter ProP [Paracoccus laeviglucosivorans]|uniref:MFS transporter, MHS family, proline/betaine transporter n=1 Tax=Paracoccus laeviglucosivorans TaxID=1197861 RepID=A0A521BI45_9RHOB|nr:glycine betaine/L-proline transporter ProP [Paracoccus laeviglucosivorans]SMO46804.1 MFS transporter, MHS family, proline/betaine transporter [Paracoccus laeviglucosivorans]